MMKIVIILLQIYDCVQYLYTFISLYCCIPVMISNSIAFLKFYNLIYTYIFDVFYLIDVINNDCLFACYIVILNKYKFDGFNMYQEHYVDLQL